MIDGILESIFGAISNAVAEARRQQAEIVAEQERARAQYTAAAPAPLPAQPTRGAVARRKQAQAAQAPPRPAPGPAQVAPALVLFADRSDVLRGVVMAEVLGRPVAMRDPSTFPPGAAF